MRTGMSQGPRALRDISAINEPLDLDQTLAESVRVSISKATWLDEVDMAAAKQAVLLAETIDAHPDKRHQNAPILIGLLSNLGLLNNRKTETMSPAEMLQAIANG
jgi:arginase family enzyme